MRRHAAAIFAATLLASGAPRHIEAQSPCPDPATWSITGTVHELGTNERVADARVVVTLLESFQFSNGTLDGEVTDSSVTDAKGLYVICGIPPNSAITLLARDETRVSEVAHLMFSGDSLNIGNRLRRNDPSRRWNQPLELASASDRLVSLSGVVTNATTGDPVPYAAVRLVGTTTTIRADAMGTFRVQALAGSQRLAARSVGYQPKEYMIDLPTGGPAHIPAGGLQLDPIPYELDPVSIAGESTSDNRKLVEFEGRRARGFGEFLTREDFARFNPTKTTDVLRILRTFRVRPNPDYLVERWDTRENVVESSRSLPGSHDNECPALFYVDGIRMGTTKSTEIDQTVFVDDIDVVEAYRDGEIPPEFMAAGATCGVIAIWTR